MRRQLETTLDLLDEGLRLYRRGFVTFALLAALGFAPLIVGVGTTFAAARYWSSEAIVLLVLAWLVAGVLLLLYCTGAMSRVAIALRARQNPGLRAVLGMGPLRTASMGCFGLIYGMLVNVIISLGSCIIFLPLSCFMSLGFGAASGAAASLGEIGAALASFLLSLALLTTIVLYGISLVLSGAGYSWMLYGIQPFVLSDMPVRRAMSHSFDLLFYQFWRNLLVFFGASAIFSALTVAVTIAVGVLLPLPLYIALGPDSLWAQGLSASAWLLGLVLVLPPMPIWMTLLYERNRRDRDGDALIERVALLAHEAGG
ncbi:hypothetical protein HC891_08670 [Candidatus Gracilibacteria bacterium]|nr:hypothetical protein [Candidatus Gracilibacteria bacterium]